MHVWVLILELQIFLVTRCEAWLRGKRTTKAELNNKKQKREKEKICKHLDQSSPPVLSGRVSWILAHNLLYISVACTAHANRSTYKRTHIGGGGGGRSCSHCACGSPSVIDYGRMMGTILVYMEPIHHLAVVGKGRCLAYEITLSRRT